jgi:16S rRNA processing protein RimM
MKKKYLEAGKIVSTFGIKGEVNLVSYCNTPTELAALKTLYSSDGKKSFTVESSFVKKTTAVIKFAGIDTVEAAQKYRDKVLYLDRDDVKLPDGSYFYQDLMGMTVVDDETGDEYGIITDITFTGAHDVYHVTSKTGAVSMIPAVPEFISETDIEGGIMKINIIEGLINEV